MSIIQKRNEKVFVASSLSWHELWSKMAKIRWCYVGTGCGWRYTCNKWLFVGACFSRLATSWAFILARTFINHAKKKCHHILEYASFLSRLESLICGLSNLSVIVQLLLLSQTKFQFLLLMAEILHQLRLVVYPIICRVSAPSQVVSPISSINSNLVDFQGRMRQRFQRKANKKSEFFSELGRFFFLEILIDWIWHNF